MKRHEFSYDRRGLPRILSGYPVDIKIENPPSGIPPSISGEIGNMSSEGASLLLDSSLPVSAIVTLRIDLSPDYSQIETKAQVMWSYFLARNKKFNCGVRFLDLGEKNQEVLNKLIGEGIENNKSVPERRRSDRRTKTKELKERLWKAEMVLKKVKKTMDRRVVITGLGVIAPNGIGKDAFWKAIKSGKSGIRKITRFDPSEFPSQIAGEINGFDSSDFISPKKARHMDRFAQLAVSAAKMAIEDSQFRINKNNVHRIGVTMSSAVGGTDFAEQQHDIFREAGIKKVSPFLAISLFPGSCSSQVSIEMGIKGYGNTVSTACAAGTDAIGCAFHSIRHGLADAMITGGADAPIAPLTFGAFCAMGALSKRNDEPEKASRPFNKDRDGFVMSEGAAVIILEELEYALRRGAHIYAEVVGYGSTYDAYHMTAFNPDGKEPARAIRLALEEVGLGPRDVDYINAHGTSTPINDRVETLAIKQVFGDHAYRIPVSSTKSMTGHSLAGAGAIELVACALTLENQFIHPTINYENPDPECDLDYVPNKGRKLGISVIVSNSFGFGGKNACIVIRKYKG